MENIHPNTDSSSSHKRQYHLHIDIDREYEPLQKRNKSISLSKLDRENLRCQGKKSLDLWCDGSIYPIDPCLRSAPNFKNVTSLLKFTGDGQNGLLGYCTNLVANRNQVAQFNSLLSSQNVYLLQQQQLCVQKISSSEETIRELEGELRSPV